MFSQIRFSALSEPQVMPASGTAPELDISRENTIKMPGKFHRNGLRLDRRRFRLGADLHSALSGELCDLVMISSLSNPKLAPKRVTQFPSNLLRKMVLPVRIELTTSALPRMRSTTELRQHCLRKAGSRGVAPGGVGGLWTKRGSASRRLADCSPMRLSSTL